MIKNHVFVRKKGNLMTIILDINISGHRKGRVYIPMQHVTCIAHNYKEGEKLDCVVFDLSTYGIRVSLNQDDAQLLANALENNMTVALRPTAFEFIKGK